MTTERDWLFSSLLHVGEYRTIVADPPWTPELGATWATRFTDKARPQKHYETMGLDAIKALPVPDLVGDQAHLWLWALTQHVDDAFDVARAWGFVPITMLTWCKPGLGVGQFQCNTEHVVVARRGSRHGNPFGMTGGTWFNWPRGRHSAKPEAFYDLVTRCSPGPFVELFARGKRLGWDVWGNEAPTDRCRAYGCRWEPVRCPRCEGAGDAIPQLPHALGCPEDGSDPLAHPDDDQAVRW